MRFLSRNFKGLTTSVLTPEDDRTLPAVEVEGNIICLFLARQPPPPHLQWAMVSSFTRFLDHTERRNTFGRTSLDEWSARRRYLYLTTQHSQQTDFHTSCGIRTHNLSRRAALDRAATGTCEGKIRLSKLTRIQLLLPDGCNKLVIKYEILNQNSRVRSQSVDILILSETGKQQTIEIYRISLFYGALLDFFLCEGQNPFYKQENISPWGVIYFVFYIVIDTIFSVM